MKTFGRLLILTLIFSPFLLSAGAQTVTIDPALLAKANAGDAAAQVAVGERYAAAAANEYSAADAGADYKTAAAWYLKAAGKGGHPGNPAGELAADLHLAALYRDGGKGFPRDMAQAAAWYRKAAEQGDASAQATLALLYSIGQGVDQDFVEAYYWASLAAAAKGPNQEQYAANRQMVGTHLTLDQVQDVQHRVGLWLAAHPGAQTAQ